MVRVRGDRIDAAGPAASVAAADAKVIDLPGTTLLPGLVEGHSHVLLHPYDETTWNDQVLKESLGLRIARATNHLRNTLMAGFTTIRDLGTEGRRVRGRRAEAGRRSGHHPGTAHAGRPRARSSRPAATGRRVTRSNGVCRRGPRRPTASTR